MIPRVSMKNPTEHRLLSCQRGVMFRSDKKYLTVESQELNCWYNKQFGSNQIQLELAQPSHEDAISDVVAPDEEYNQPQVSKYTRIPLQCRVPRATGGQSEMVTQ